MYPCEQDVTVMGDLNADCSYFYKERKKDQGAKGNKAQKWLGQNL